MSESKIPLKVGDSCSFAKTLSESDTYLFGGIIGDFASLHFNEEFAKKTFYGKRVVHGCLTFSLASTVSTLIQQHHPGIPATSYGYDHLRFTAPVFFGDTITATYEVTEVDETNMKTYADVTMTNQDGKVVCVARHILKFYELEE